MKKSINLTKELAQIIQFSANVATAIKMRAPHVGMNKKETKESIHDIIWLSEILHQFVELATVIQADNETAVIHACNTLMVMFESYSQGNSKIFHDTSSKDTLDRHEHLFSLQEVAKTISMVRFKAARHIRNNEQMLEVD